MKVCYSSLFSNNELMSIHFQFILQNLLAYLCVICIVFVL